MRTFIYCFIFFSFFFYNPIFGQEVKLQKGSVTAGIPLSDSLTQTFSIYLPTTFRQDSLGKTLIVLDPEGRGAQAARLFQAGAIEEDFVVAANDFPLTDSLGQNTDLVLHMMKKALSISRTDPAHLYVAGLEEGALTAASLPYSIQGISGLLVVNDIFVRDRPGARRFRTLMVGLVGESSANYYKMQRTFGRLQSINTDNHLLTYDGEGGWPAPEYLGTLLHDLLINNLDRRNIELPETSINAYFDYDMNTVGAMIRKREYLVAYDLLDQLKDTYGGTHALKPLRKQLQDLRRHRGYKEQRNQMYRDAEDEQLLLSDLDYFLEEDIANANFENLGFWDEKIRSFEAAASDDQKPSEQRVAKRMLGFLENSVQDYEGILVKVNPSASQLIFLKVFKTVMDPEDYRSYQQAISLAAKDGDDNTAYFYLEEMLKNGFTDYEGLYNIPHTQLLRTSSIYNGIVKKYFGRSKF